MYLGMVEQVRLQTVVAGRSGDDGDRAVTDIYCPVSERSAGRLGAEWLGRDKRVVVGERHQRKTGQRPAVNAYPV